MKEDHNMKKYFYFAAALLFAAISCTKETPDTNTELPDAGKQSGRKTIVLNIAGSDTKTYVSDPAAGTISWETGDVVGVFTDKDVTEPLRFTLSGEPGTSATFKGEVSDGASHIYVFYPYSAYATFDDGKITMTLPSEQSVGTNNVAKGAMVAVGEATKGGNGSYSARLNNAFSYIKFKITGDDIKEIVLSGGADKLAGTATFSVADGTMIGTGTSASITATKAGGYFTKDTYYYIPVLPGDVAALSFSMTSNTHGTDTGTADFDDWKAERVAGSALTFTRGTGLKFDALDQGTKWNWYFDIHDAASLERFRALVAADNFPAAGVAKFTSDIDLSGETLAAAAGTFKGTLDGQGHSITNWTSNGVSLFEKVDGKVLRVQIANSCTLVPEIGDNFGFIANQVTQSGIIDACYNHADITCTFTSETKFSIGALVGNSSGVVKNCVNSGNISLTSEVSTSPVAYIGGLVGSVSVPSDSELKVLDANKNTGNIIYTVKNKTEYVYIGGITAGSYDLAAKDVDSPMGVISNCTNEGSVVYNLFNGGSSFEAGSSGNGNVCNVGGIAGCFAGKISGCTNGKANDSLGSISVNAPTSDTAACITRPAVGGVAAYVMFGAEDCYNYGPISFKGTCAGLGLTASPNGLATGIEGTGVLECPSFGGVFAQVGPGKTESSGSDRGASLLVNNCENHGDVTIYPWMAIMNGTEFCSGGVIGYSGIPSSSCANYNAVTVYAKGAVNNIAGVIGRTIYDVSSCENRGVLNVTLQKSLSDDSDGQISNLQRIGGVVGYSNSGANIESCTNCSEVIVNTEITSSAVGKIGQQIVGGVVGRFDGVSFSLNENKADVTVGGDSIIGTSGTGSLVIGGTAGWLVCSEIQTSIKNSGCVSYQGKTDKTIWLGGCAGYVNLTSCTVSGAANSRSVETGEESSVATLHVGGVFGNATTGTSITIPEAINSAGITINGTVTTLNAGGIIGRLEGNGTKDVTNCENRPEGDIISKKSVGTFNCGGIIGLSESVGAVTLKNNTNCGEISNVGSISSPRFGGIVGYHNKTAGVSLEGNKNYGVVKQTQFVNGTAWYGGIMGVGIVSKAQNNKNYSGGDIQITEAAKNAIRCGGIIGHLQTTAVSFEDCDNEANISVISGNGGSMTGANTGTNLTVAGVIGFYEPACNANSIDGIINCDNSGKIEVSVAKTGTSQVYVGGVLNANSNGDTNLKIKNCTSTNDIIVGKVTNGCRIGGILSYAGGGSSFSNNKFTGSLLVGEDNGIGGSCYVGGIIGYTASGSYDGNKVVGSIAVGKAGTSGGTAYVGGIAGQVGNTNPSFLKCNVGGQISKNSGSGYVGIFTSSSNQSSKTFTFGNAANKSYVYNGMTVNSVAITPSNLLSYLVSSYNNPVISDNSDVSMIDYSD